MKQIVDIFLDDHLLRTASKIQTVLGLEYLLMSAFKRLQNYEFRSYNDLSKHAMEIIEVSDLDLTFYPEEVDDLFGYENKFIDDFCSIVEQIAITIGRIIPTYNGHMLIAPLGYVLLYSSTLAVRGNMFKVVLSPYPRKE